MGIVLDARLAAIAALVGKCSLYADIGCDHGRLGAYLLTTNQVERAVLTDISADSLMKARRLMSRLDISERVEFRVCDGSKGLEGRPQAVVIAGMGGTTIATIIREGRSDLGGARLILQPNVAVYELRATLCECGYRIDDERVVRDGGRHYVIIAAEPGEARYTEEELTVGPVLLRNRPESLSSYAAFRLRVAEKALQGALRGGDGEQVAALEREIALWKEIGA